MTDNIVVNNEELEYSFIIYTFNQEDTVIETLESIRYQISKYGKGKRIQLILCDDASSDKTVKYCKLWIKKYGYLFDVIDELFSKVNRGNCKNYTDGLRTIKGSKYREISGDDILPKSNIFAIMDKLEDIDVLAGLVIPFSNYKVKADEKQYLSILLQSVYNSSKLKFLTKVTNPIHNGHLLSRKLHSEELFNYIEQFDLIEDRPLYYYLFSKNENIKYGYYKFPILLYRISCGSMTHSNGSVTERYLKDYRLVYEKIMNGEKKLSIRIWKWLDDRIKKYNPSNLYMWTLVIFHRKEIHRLFVDYVVPAISDSNTHLQNIRNEAQIFLEEI